MRDNGLTASAYTSMGGIDPLVAEPVLSALAEAGIAAYCGGPGEPAPSPEATEAIEAAADSADGEAEAAEASSSTQPSGAEGDAKADADEAPGGRRRRRECRLPRRLMRLSRCGCRLGLMRFLWIRSLRSGLGR